MGWRGVKNSTQSLLVVMDNRQEIALITSNLSSFSGQLMNNSARNDDDDDDLGYEGVSFDFQGGNNGTMEIFSVIESLKHDHGYQSRLYIWDSNFSVIGEQWLGEVGF